MEYALLKFDGREIYLTETRKVEFHKLALMAKHEYICPFCKVDVVLSSYRPDNKKEAYFKAKHTHKPYCENKRRAHAALMAATSLDDVDDISDKDLVYFGNKTPHSKFIVPERIYVAGVKHLKLVKTYTTKGVKSGYLYNYKHPYFHGFCFWSSKEIDLVNSTHIVFFLLKELEKKPERYGTKNWASKNLIFKEVSI